MEDFSFGVADSHIVTAKASIENADYPAAVDDFGKAIAICETGLLRLYAAQASALSSAEKYDDCLKIAEKAIRAFPNDATSWYWKGQALFKMRRLSEAKKSFQKAASFESIRTSKMSYLDWANQCDETPDADGDEEMDVIDATGTAARTVPRNEISNSAATKIAGQASSTKSQPPPQPQPQPPADKTRMQWYQSSSHVVIDVYAKDVEKEKSTVTFEPSHLVVRLSRPNAPDYILDKDLLENINPEQSTWSASRFKVEIRMKKVNTGVTWKALDKGEEVLSAAVQAGAESKQRNQVQKERQKEWASLTEKELKDYKEDDSPMALFRTLYKDADEDVRRAMMKSYQESGGQVLSTNWDEVKKKKVVYEGDS